jgi:alpha-L-fucosidase
VGFYFSPEDFNFLRLHHIPISRTDVKMNEAVKKEFDDYTRTQCEELMRQYGKIDLLFIDGEPKETVKETCWKIQPDILITRGALRTPEQMMPGIMINEPWLSCITMGTAWQFQPTNERYKPGTQLLQLLIEARSKGGNLLLNIGPKADGSMPEEQEGRLREMAAWYFVNKEAVDSVRPWVITNEGNTWFTLSADKKSLYAFVTGLPEWKEGERKSFVLHSVKATPATILNVLGQNSRIIEYNKNPAVNCTFQQTDTGLLVSVVRAQRIYDDHRWPNPVVIKLENVLPAIRPLAVETLEGEVKTGKGLLKGRILNYKNETVTAYFYYRPYRGQLETLYAGPWRKTVRASVHADGVFETMLLLPKGTKYEYKAMVEYARIAINGENKTIAWQF